MGRIDGDPWTDAVLLGETRYWRRLALGAGLVLAAAGLAVGCVVVAVRRLWS